MKYHKFSDFLANAIGFTIGWRLRDHQLKQKALAQQEVSDLSHSMTLEAQG